MVQVFYFASSVFPPREFTTIGKSPAATLKCCVVVVIVVPQMLNVKKSRAAAAPAQD